MAHAESTRRRPADNVGPMPDWTEPSPERPPMPGGSLFGALLAGQERMRERRHESGGSES